MIPNGSPAAKSHLITDYERTPPKKSDGPKLWHTLVIIAVLMTPTFLLGLLVGWIIF